MADFLKAYALTREFEGGYVNDPADPGGETYKGIARRKQPRWQGWAIIDGLKKNADFPALLYKNATLNAMVLDFYKHEFWDFLCCDSIQSQAVAYELFDTAVNMGRETAATFLQQALNVANNNGKLYADIAEDGDIGPATLAAFHKHPNPQTILKILNVLQGARYINIARNNPSQEKYINGWFKRVFELDMAA